MRAIVNFDYDSFLVRNCGSVNISLRIAIETVPIDFGVGRPSQDRIAGQLCAVVADDRLGLAARSNQDIEPILLHRQERPSKSDR